MTSYTCDVHNDKDEDSFTQIIQVGSHTLTFHFQWAIVSEEQYKIVHDYLVNKANTDPLVHSGEYNRTYNWFNYYYNLVNKDLDEWLDSNPVLPVSLNSKSRDVQKYLLTLYIAEAKALEPAIRIYNDVIRWQFTMTGADVDTAVGYVQPGGWYHNQDNILSFRFVSELDNIDRSTISAVSLEFEVYDE